MRKFLHTTILFKILLLLPLLTNAQLVQGEGYAGASMGVPIYDKLNKTDVGYKIYGGYMLYDYLGLDIAYVNLGNPKSGNGNLEASGANVAAILRFLINRQISLFGKLGSFVWDTKNPSGSSDNGNSLSFGAGASFNARDNIFIHGEIEKFETSNESIIMYSLGLKVAF